jgi:5-methylcytosine-specific restriction endonuclease McrA
MARARAPLTEAQKRSGREAALRYAKSPKGCATQNAYRKRRRADHPEDVRAEDRARYARDNVRLKARVKARREYDPEREKLDRKAEYDRNKNKAKADAKAWREANPEHAAATKRAYRDANRERVLVAERAKNARRKGAPGHFTAEDIRRIFVAQDGRCYYCAEPLTRQHVEHKTPIVRGGSNDPSNLAVACPGCNLRKGQMTEAEFRIVVATRPICS